MLVKGAPVYTNIRVLLHELFDDITNIIIYFDRTYDFDFTHD